jgi:hypothetical protein
VNEELCNALLCLFIHQVGLPLTEMDEVYITGEAVTFHLWLLFCSLYGKMTPCLWYHQILSLPMYKSLFEIFMLSTLLEHRGVSDRTASNAFFIFKKLQTGSGSHSVTIRWVKRTVRHISVGIATFSGLDSPGIESRWGARFSAPV